MGKGKDADAPPSAKKLIKATLKKGPLDVTAVRATVVRQLVAQGKSEKKASSLLDAKLQLPDFVLGADGVLRLAGAQAAAPTKRAADDADAPPAKKAKAASSSTRKSPRLAAASADASSVPVDALDGGGSSSTTTLSPDAWRAEHSVEGNKRLPDPLQSFESTPFSPKIKARLTSLGFSAPSAIQAQAWPVALSGADLIAVAKTGSGKTIGFLLPAFHHIASQPPLPPGQGPTALVLAPTRELAQQIEVEAEKFSAHGGCKTCVVYGGAPKGPQIGILSRGRPALVVGTPGRCNDLLELANPPVTNLDHCVFLVLDEADRMLDMGFEPQIKTIIAKMPAERQTLFFTATWPKEVRAMASAYLRPNPIQITIGGSGEKLVANKDVAQSFVLVDGGEAGKPEAFAKVVADECGASDSKVIVFCNTKLGCEKLAFAQRRSGSGAVAIHGDKDQWERERALAQFTDGRAWMLFGTDVAARGLDVKNVTHVINYDLPSGDDGTESYVHRIGRTGRAGSKGRAISLYLEKVDRKVGAALAPILRDAAQPVPDFIAEAEESCRRRGGGGRGWGGKGRGGGGKGKGRGGKGGGKGGRGKGGGGKGWKW